MSPALTGIDRPAGRCWLALMKPDSCNGTEDDNGGRIGRLRASGTGASAGGGGGAVRFSRRHVRGRRRGHPGAGILRMFSPRRRPARGADAAVHRHFARHHHPNLGQFVSCPFCALRVFARATWKFGDDLPQGPLMRIYGFLIGLLSTLMGIGGGLFANLLMTFYSRRIHQAVATSSALAVLISIPGALGYVYAGWPAAVRYPDVAALQLPFAVGYVSLIGALLVIPTSLLIAPLGVRAAHAMSKRALEMAFGTYLFIVGGRFVISLVSGQ